jgi:cytoplasmic iron level regulating protein YaaA (DUF328/UPF0246 family)
MMIVLSPSKSMQMDSAASPDCTQPEFLDRSEELVSNLRNFSAQDLASFMAISEKLTELNKKRFANWSRPFTPDNAKPATLTFTGDVYDGLDASSLKKRDLQFAQKHLRILSGLYGLLRPLDLIQPYRLEMGRPLKTDNAKNLYEFWRDTITAELNHLPGDHLINLASQEYFKAIDKKALNKQIISPVFKDEKNGTFKIISFYAKCARGSMARFLIENQITHSDDITAFNINGYTYAEELSSETAPVFIRSESFMHRPS